MRRASLGKLSGLGSVKIHLTDLNVVQEQVRVKLELEFSSLFVSGNINYIDSPAIVHIFPFFKRG